MPNGASVSSFLAMVTEKKQQFGLDLQMCVCREMCAGVKCREAGSENRTLIQSQGHENVEL